jgi:hypothetical protein
MGATILISVENLAYVEDPNPSGYQKLRKAHFERSGSPFNRSKPAADTTEPAGQAGSRPRHADSRGRALTCAAPVTKEFTGF